VLAVEPRNALALARIAGLSHTEGLRADHADKLHVALAGPGLSAADRADLNFALAALLDAAADYDAAFAAAIVANAASRESGGAAARYDRAAHERLIGRVIATFDKPCVSAKTAECDDNLLFICGLFRSGSTLVEQILARHSQVTAGGELQAIPVLAARIQGYPESLASIENTGALEAMRQSYFGSLPPRPPGSMFTDKRPDNFIHLGLIKTLFPKAKIIHTMRNPLDNIISLYFAHLDPSISYALDLDDAAHWFLQYKRLIAHWKRVYPGDIVDVDYDALVATPRRAIQSLLEACHLPWEEAVLDFHRGGAVVKTASVWQVRQPIHNRSSGRWHHYARHLDTVRKRIDGKVG
jgi:hypothetical protein